MCKKILLFISGIISGFLLGLMALGKCLPFYCGENFSRIYAINTLYASKLIDEGDYEHAIGILKGVENTYHEQKECVEFGAWSIMLGSVIHMTGGNFDAINDAFRLREIELLKKKAMDRKETSIKTIEKKV